MVALNMEAKLMDVVDPSSPNRFNENEAITVSYAHAWRDSSNTMHLIKVFEALSGEDCVA